MNSHHRCRPDQHLERRYWSKNTEKLRWNFTLLKILWNYASGANQLMKIVRRTNFTFDKSFRWTKFFVGRNFSLDKIFSLDNIFGGQTFMGTKFSAASHISELLSAEILSDKAPWHNPQRRDHGRAGPPCNYTPLMFWIQMRYRQHVCCRKVDLDGELRGRTTLYGRSLRSNGNRILEEE